MSLTGTGMRFSAASVQGGREPLERHLHATESASTRLCSEGEKTMSRNTIFTLRTIMWSAVLVSLVVLALREQLRLSAEKRTWHGRIWGRIPYDFRLPTAKPTTCRVLE